MLLARLTAVALPFLARKVVRAVRVRLPIPFDLRGSRTVSVSFGGVRTDSISAVCGLTCLAELDGILAARRGVRYNFCESFFHGVLRLRERFSLALLLVFITTILD